jgi:hypothetical protein
MTTALAPRRMLLSFLLAAAVLLAVGAGHALAAQRPAVAHRTTAVPNRALAYANACSPMLAVSQPVAYADGLLTPARRHHRRRRVLVHAS